jgi:hypothetical protein
MACEQFFGNAYMVDVCWGEQSTATSSRNV